MAKHKTIKIDEIFVDPNPLQCILLRVELTTTASNYALVYSFSRKISVINHILKRLLG